MHEFKESWVPLTELQDSSRLKVKAMLPFAAVSDFLQCDKMNAVPWGTVTARPIAKGEGGVKGWGVPHRWWQGGLLLQEEPSTAGRLNDSWRETRLVL